MASTYTTNTGIEKPDTGDKSGTWGTMTNTNMDLIDQALDGFISITAAATGSTGSPNTLPITDGSVSNGRNRIIKIVDGGDLGGTVYYQITPNDAEKYVQKNWQRLPNNASSMTTESALKALKEFKTFYKK